MRKEVNYYKNYKRMIFNVCSAKICPVCGTKMEKRSQDGWRCGSCGYITYDN